MVFSYDCTNCGGRMHAIEPLEKCPFPIKAGVVCGGELMKEGEIRINPSIPWFCQSCQREHDGRVNRVGHFKEFHGFMEADD